MTVPATARRAGPYNGNGSTTSFSFSFKTFAAGDLEVTRTSATGIESVLVLNADYTVTLNPDQDTSPGGTITYPITGSPLAAGEKLTIVGSLAYEQTTDLLGGGAFNARVIEDTFDRTVIQIQQLEERADRTLTLPVSAAASTVLPVPAANKVIAWNDTASGLVNRDAADFASAVAYANWRSDLFSGNGSTTQFTLAADPGNVNNMDVSISGVTQVNGVNFTVSGTTLTFTVAPPAGTNNILVRYGQALPVGTANASMVTFNPAGAGAQARTAESKMRDTLCVLDFMSAAQIADVQARTLALDVTSAMQAAHTAADGRPVYYPRGAYRFSSITLAKSGDGIVGDGSGGMTGEDQTLLVSTVTGTTPAILLTTSQAHNVILKDCTIKQQSGTVQGRGVSMQDCYWFRTDNLRIIGFTDNIYASLSIYHHHKRLLSEKSANGVNYWGAAGAWNTAWFNNVLTFDTCRFSECTVTGAAVKGCEVVFINPDFTGMSATGAIGCRVYGESTSFRAHGIKILTPYLEIVKIAFSFAFARVEITGDGFVQGGPDVPGQATSIIDASESYVVASGMEDKDYWQFGYRLTNNSTLVMKRPLSGSIRATAGTADATSVFISDETRSGTFTVTLTGCTATVTGTASWERRGNIVTLLLPPLSGTSNATTCTLTGAPAAILPATEQFGMINVLNSAAETIGVYRYFTSGTISLSAGVFGTTFVSSGVKGIRASSLSYSCA